MEKKLIHYFLPDQLITCFDVEKVEEKPIPGTKRFEMRIYLTEKNVLPEGYAEEEWESKGFTEAKTVQDFPIRGKMVYLILKCRRWRHKKDPGRIIRRDLSFLAEGAKMTGDLSAFLKDTGRGA
ncbi:hypothetical protein QLX67_13590 [Balneolaceae bacterium ANBcel3]|nr:hypothetical protein [Balneolaceae bacterium ANBcel3]